MKDFFEFIREQGVIGLAVGFILGGAVSQLVASLVENIINPLIGLVIGRTDLSSYALVFGETSISYGAFLTTLVNFIVVAAVVFYIFRGLRLEQFDKKKA